ncbi:Lar family restriction alleviation protein [Stutzerimonas stutzeri]|uniref:Lar family restriction alleviation protein n=1 Tax=Stutzerimonas stutzeri TaxID=316 RepID=UPI003C2E3509
MSEELKPCPFCGGEARLDQRTTQSLWNSSDAVFSHVACDECDISGQDFCDDPNGEEASEWWNRRAQPAEAEGVVEMGSDAWMAMHLLDRLDVSADEEPRVQQVEEIVRRMGAALSAVTAEVGGWIPLAESTPPDGVPVLRWPGWAAEFSIDEWCNDYGCFLMSIEGGERATHWKPLCAPKAAMAAKEA